MFFIEMRQKYYAVFAKESQTMKLLFKMTMRKITEQLKNKSKLKKKNKKLINNKKKNKNKKTFSYQKFKFKKKFKNNKKNFRSKH